MPMSVLTGRVPPRMHRQIAGKLTGPPITKWIVAAIVVFAAMALAPP